MDELDAGDASSSSSTPRLRRRSFYENMEPDPSAFAPPPLDGVTQQTQQQSQNQSQHQHQNQNDRGGDSAAHLSSSSVTPSSKSDDHHAGSPQPPPASTSAASHGYRGGVAGALAQWLLASVLTLLYRLQRWLRVRLRLHERAPFRFVRMLRERSAAAAAVKHWAYPTQWLTLGCTTLVLVQLVVYWHFQVERFDLTVKECVFHEQLMPTTTAALSALPDAAVAGSSGAATRFLERRFEQLHDHVPSQRQHAPRMPWTCIALVATADDPLAAAITRELALLLPRHRVFEPTAADSVASRVTLFVGSAVPTARSAHAGVVGVLFPPLLSAGHDEHFVHNVHPDLVLVKTEYALKRLLALRQDPPRPAHDPRDLASDPGTDAKHQALASAHFGIYLTRATVPDIYQRRVRKDWDAFLHVVVGATQEQFTKELLTAWLAHPEWPTLHVRFAHSLELCGSFARFVSSVQRSRKQDDMDDMDDNTDTDTDTDMDADGTNVALSCDEADNRRDAIVALKNRIGVHVFPAPVEPEALEEAAVLESLAVGAIVVTYDTPVMREWVPDACGVRVGDAVSPLVASSPPPTDSATRVRVTTRDVEHAVETLLLLDRVHRVAWGRAARAHYLRLRTHFLSAMAALDAAVCDDDTDDALAAPSDLGHRSRSRVQLEALRVFLY